MNNNKIANPKVEVPTGMALNDKDYLNCLLSSLKEMEKNYAVVLTEVSNEHLHGLYKNVFDNIDQLQREAFELNFKKGWYTLEKADDQKIQQKYQMLNQEYEDMHS